MFKKNTELEPFPISNDYNAHLFNVIRINTELNVDIKYFGKNISTNWNIDKDIVGVEKYPWLIIIAEINSIEEYKYLIELNKRTKHKKMKNNNVFTVNFVKSNIKNVKFKATKRNTFIEFSKTQNSNEISDALFELLSFYTEQGIPCLDIYELQYAFRNKNFNYYSVNYKNNIELFEKINEFKNNKITKDTKQIYLTFVDIDSQFKTDIIFKIIDNFEYLYQKSRLLWGMTIYVDKPHLSFFYSN